MIQMTRRQFVLATGAAAAGTALARPLVAVAVQKAEGFSLPKLPYAYDALEPHIDAKTMQIHHDLHHQAYINNLTKAVAKHPDLAKKSIEDLLRNIKTVPEDIRQAVTNNGGGHANHTLFWEVMAKDGGKPSADLAKAVESDLGGMEKFKKDLSQAAITQFGSGWGWLVVSKGKLKVYSSPNQNSPLMVGDTPILGIDVWEHAYYLKYQNKRPDYVEAWWNVVNWKDVNDRFKDAMKG